MSDDRQPAVGSPDTTDTVVAPDVLREFVRTILVLLGARDRHAERVATSLVDADLCGQRSHGVRQMEYYAGQLQRGEIQPETDPLIVTDDGHRAVIDGQFGFGHVVAEHAAQVTLERTQRHGLALVSVRNANHIGRLGEYTELLARHGLVALMFVTSQGGGQQVAPFGGVERRLANNPISLAVPRPEGAPVMADIALSVVAESRILHASERGVDVPEGWILDREGRPTTRPDDYLVGGTLVPLGDIEGSYKGYGLIVIVELLVAMLAGAELCGREERRFSNSFVLICAVADEGQRRGADIEAFVDWVKSSRLRRGTDSILLPGEREARARAASASGVVIDASTRDLLRRVARSAGVDLSSRSRVAELLRGALIHFERIRQDDAILARGRIA